jgi:hypothetical protein
MKEAEEVNNGRVEKGHERNEEMCNKCKGKIKKNKELSQEMTK